MVVVVVVIVAVVAHVGGRSSNNTSNNVVIMVVEVAIVQQPRLRGYGARPRRPMAGGAAREMARAWHHAKRRGPRQCHRD